MYHNAFDRVKINGAVAALDGSRRLMIPRANQSGR
jgi:hypothetical protein